MLVLLNGIPLDDLNAISSISLAGIQVIKGGAASASTGAVFIQNDDPKAGSPEFGIVFLTLETKRTKYNTKPIQELAI
jgi:hypothetical protein